MEGQDTAGFVDDEPAAFPLDDALTGPLSGWRGKLVAHHPLGSVAAVDLGLGDLFSALIDRFQATRGGPDRIAATSFWSQIYFSTLIVPAVVEILVRKRGLPLGLRDMRIAFCRESGIPLQFGLGPWSGRTERMPPFEALIDGHLTPMISLMRRHSGLSSRLLWENAGWYLVWILGEMGRRHPDCLPLVREMLADGSWPAGRCHAIGGMKRAVLAGKPVTRRVCCLRHRVPGFALCEGSCPLAKGAGDAPASRRDVPNPGQANDAGPVP